MDKEEFNRLLDTLNTIYKLLQYTLVQVLFKSLSIEQRIEIIHLNNQVVDNMSKYKNMNLTNRYIELTCVYYDLISNQTWQDFYKKYLEKYDSRSAMHIKMFKDFTKDCIE